MAGDQAVGLHSAAVMQQALTLDSSITLERTRALVTPAATHLGFRVVR